MTDYKEGVWYGWNGGDCPVGLKDMVKVFFSDGTQNTKDFKGEEYNWLADIGQKTIVAFQITKKYVGPREFWINEYPTFLSQMYLTKEAAERSKCPNRVRLIHVREVNE